MNTNYIEEALRNLNSICESLGTEEVDGLIRNSEDYVGDHSIERQIRDILNYHLGEGEQYADVDSFDIISNPGNGDFGDVEAQYHVNVKIPVGRDPETGQMEYEYDTEYRSDVFQVVLRK